eukprot:3859217-Pleurochrysis_carterae.AAC.3
MATSIQAADAGGMAAAKKPRSCLAKAIGAFLDGGIIGGAIGGIMASRTAIAFGPSLGALRILAVGMGQSGLSLGGFLAAYNGSQRCGVKMNFAFKRQFDVPAY